MEFKVNKPIYLQIADFCFGKIVSHEWEEDLRIPSVRDLAVLLQVNPNTVMRAFEYLQAEEVIYTKRGMGYYVNLDARKHIGKLQKNDFYKQTLPDTFAAMQLLNISIADVEEQYNQFIETNKIIEQ